MTQNRDSATEEWDSWVPDIPVVGQPQSWVQYTLQPFDSEDAARTWAQRHIPGARIKIERR